MVNCHKLECDEGLVNEINLPKDARRWWDTYQKRSLEVKKRTFWLKNHRKMPRVACTLRAKVRISMI